MDLDSVAVRQFENRRSRFELAAPRRFLLPAVLLLLAEEPRHGYSLAKELTDLRFGHIDRPSVYRALAQLERDGLVTSDADAPKPGQARRAYRITEAGERVLRQWMGVIKDERDGLDRVLRRYVASPIDRGAAGRGRRGLAGRHEAGVLAGAAELAPRRRPPVSSPRQRRSARREDAGATAEAARYLVDPDRSVVLISARSSVGPILFGAARPHR